MFTCNGELITCYYYSTSAGATNDLSVWGAEKREYIAVQGLENTGSLDLTQNADFSRYIRSNYECYDTLSPFYRWQAKLDISNIKESEYGQLHSIEVRKRNAAGYITELVIHYANKDVTLKKELEIRKKLGQYLKEIVLSNEKIRTDLSMLPSACFEVLKTENGIVTLCGGGYGHGIGMSQYGANAMASAGYNYKQIIEYYYENIVIKK